MTYRRFAGFVAACSLIACSAPTSYHLIASTDELKVMVSSTALPDNWQQASFDDSAWQTVAGQKVGPLAPSGDGTMPVVAVRRTFDLGPQASAYHSMQLTVTTEGSWTAWLNGKQLAVSGATATAPVTLAVPDGLPLAAGNVLAVEVQPVAGQSMLDVSIELQGQPDATAAQQPEIVRGPWLTSPTTTGVTVVWETSQPVASTLVVDTHSYDGGNGTHHVVTVNDLQPSQTYPYHVELALPSTTVKSEEAQLTTSAQPGERVKFVVYGDNRTNGDAHRRVVEAIEAEGPDFVVNTGDLVDASSDNEWDDFFNIEYSLIRHIPIFPALGNHEASSGGGGRFAELFPMIGRPSGMQAYSADFGDVHLASLDSNGDLGAQAKWLDQDFTAAEQRGAKHLFVFLHWGPYSSGTSLMHGSNDDAQPVADVAKQHGADALFSGHDHFYERGLSANLHYFVTGGGGAPLDTPGRISETQVTKSANHYLVVDIAGSTATITAKDTTGNPFDSISGGP